jgi:carbon storage regulator
MLVLSRKSGETVFIGDRIKIRVMGVGSGRVRIGVDAPQDVHILRGELSDWSARDDSDRCPSTGNSARN